MFSVLCFALVVSIAVPGVGLKAVIAGRLSTNVFDLA